MSVGEVWQQVWARLEPVGALVAPSGGVLVLIGAVAFACVAIGPIWRVLRLAVTLVHELGHAFVGVLVGRRFTGFVLRGDMSGHAVTVGAARGFGRVATTWAGYPMPALVAAALAWVVSRGYAGCALALALLLLLVALPRVRSMLTFVAVLAAGAALGALWWWRDDALQAQVLLGVSILLLVGAWRHLGAVFSGGGAGSDPAVLRQLTGLPVLVWNTSFALVLAAGTWLVASTLLR